MFNSKKISHSRLWKFAWVIHVSYFELQCHNLKSFHAKKQNDFKVS